MVPLSQSGLRKTEHVAFYDQIHTTGMDIKHELRCCAADYFARNTFRDYAQAAFRMRGIGQGQTIDLLITPRYTSALEKSWSLWGSTDQEQSGLPNDLIAWLSLNQMRSEQIQFQLLCEQSIRNVWQRMFTQVCQFDNCID